MNIMEHKNNPRAGVTLIEMLVVVVIIAVFAAVVGPRLLNQGDKARVVAARQQLENFGLALGQYHLDTGGYPSTEQGLAALRVQPSRSRTMARAVSAKGCCARSLGACVRVQIPGRSWRRTGSQSLMARTDNRAARIPERRDIVSWK